MPIVVKDGLVLRFILSWTGLREDNLVAPKFRLSFKSHIILNGNSWDITSDAFQS